MSNLSIVFLSHTYRGGAFKVGSHHLAREMVKLGHEVAHISSPLSYVHMIAGKGTRERRSAARRGPHRDADGVIDYTPMTLLPPALMWNRHQAKRVLDKVGIPAPDIIFIDEPLMESEYYSRFRYIFRPTDVFERRATRARLPALMRAVHGVIATSAGVYDSLPPSCLPNVIIANGVEVQRFRSDPEGGNGFVYIGAIDFRFDLSAVVHLAHEFPEERVDIFGPLGIDIPPQRALPGNLNFHGALPYESIPTTLSTYRIGLLPLLNMERNRTRSPMKLYEYLASGLFVLAPNFCLPEQKLLPGIVGYDDPRALALSSIRAALHGARNSLGMRAARDNDWSSIARSEVRFALDLNEVRNDVL